MVDDDIQKGNPIDVFIGAFNQLGRSEGDNQLAEAIDVTLKTPPNAIREIYDPEREPFPYIEMLLRIVHQMRDDSEIEVPNYTRLAGGLATEFERLTTLSFAVKGLLNQDCDPQEREEVERLSTILASFANCHVGGGIADLVKKMQDAIDARNASDQPTLTIDLRKLGGNGERER